MIIIENKEFKIHLYDKTDAFRFPIVHLQHFGSNIPSNIYCASIGSEILRFARATSNIYTFKTIQKIQKQGSKLRSIISTLNKITGKYSTFLQTQQKTS